MIIAICAALSAAAAPLLEGANPQAASAATWALDARAHIATCQNDVGFLVRLGRVLLMLGQPEEAAEHLERALLLSPDDPSALRAFAGALAALGDTASARQLLATAPGKPAPPITPTIQSEWRDGWSLTSGAERNLLGATSVSSLTLTLPGLDASMPVLITLPLDPSTQAKGGEYWQLAASGQWLHRRVSSGPVPVQNDWTLQVGARTRQAPRLVQAGFISVDAALLHQSRYLGTPWGHQLQVSAAHLASRTGITFTQSGLGAGVDWAGQGCSARAGVEWMDRRYPANEILDGRQTIRVAQLGCGSAAQLIFRSGLDQPRNPARPGGAQLLTELRFRGEAQRWSWEVEWGRTVDEQGYSPLLNSGEPRRQWRRQARIEYLASNRPARSQSTCTNCRSRQLILGMEVSQRDSNIDLFKNSNLGAFIALQWTK